MKCVCVLGAELARAPEVQQHQLPGRPGHTGPLQPGRVHQVRETRLSLAQEQLQPTQHRQQRRHGQ